MNALIDKSIVSFTIVFLLLFYSCKSDEEIALNSLNTKAGIAALNKISEPYTIQNIAKHAEKCEVREAAIGKISDESVLFEFAEDPFGCTQKAAILRMGNRALIAKAFGHVSDTTIAQELINKFRDDLFIADLSIDHSDSTMREFLNRQIMIPEYKLLLRSAMAIPGSEYRKSFLWKFWPVVRFLIDPAVKNKVGEINSFNFKWELLKAGYVWLNLTTHEASGRAYQKVVCKVNFDKNISPLSEVVYSDPEAVYVFKDVEKIIEPLFRLLNEDETRKFTDESWPESIRILAKNKLKGH